MDPVHTEESVPLLEDFVCFVDTETSGLDPTYHDIVEIAAIITDENLNELERYESKVKLRNPNRLDPGAAKINGYREEVWAKEARPFWEFQGWLSRLIPYGHVAIPVGHKVDFDRQFIESYYKPIGKFCPIAYHMIDTAGLSMVLKLAGVIDVPDVKLGTVCQALKFQEQPTHRAMDDCEAAKRIFEFVVAVLKS